MEYKRPDAVAGFILKLQQQRRRNSRAALGSAAPSIHTHANNTYKIMLWTSNDEFDDVAVL
jgi:hypothetical protein